MERDDIIEYSLDAHHSEEAGKKIRKKILMVTIILTVITAVEVGVGMVWPKNYFEEGAMAWTIIKYSYIILTLVKAAYIVMVFMHLGDERKSFKWIVLAPYIAFILYLLWICVQEANYTNDQREMYEGEKPALEMAPEEPAPAAAAYEATEES